MSYRDWFVGMKVVCVADASEWRNQYMNLPQLGQVYTIRDICADEGSVFVRLVEVVNSPLPGMTYEPDFEAAAFRPVQKRNTDIEIFKRLLTDPHVKIREDA